MIPPIRLEGIHPLFAICSDSPETHLRVSRIGVANRIIKVSPNPQGPDHPSGPCLFFASATLVATSPKRRFGHWE